MRNFTRLQQSLGGRSRNQANFKLQRGFSSFSSNEVFRIAVIGSGPSGYYTANYLNKELADSQEKRGFTTTIDVIDRFSIAGGLVRSGVAPDHPEVKNINNQLVALFQSSKPNGNQVNFYGNVEVGRTDELQFDQTNLLIKIPFSLMQQSYHAIVIVFF